MKHRGCDFLRGGLLIACVLLGWNGLLMAEPTRAAVAGFDVYSGVVEARLAKQHRAVQGYLAPVQDEKKVRAGELVVEKVQEPNVPPAAKDFPGALLHHWRGTAFAPGAKAADFSKILRDFDAYPRYFAPQVVKAKVLSRDGDREQASMRIRQKHVITVVLDATYDVAFGRLDPQHGYSLSRSTKIEEIDAAGTNKERTLSAGEEHGFLWRLNTYWSYEERDGGLYLQVEGVSLTRAIPSGLGWVVRPYVESIPRESLEFTLRSACDALRK